MADGFDIHLDEDQAARLKAAADKLDMSAEDYAALLIDQGLAESPAEWIDRDLDMAPLHTVDPDPAIDRAITERMKRTGEGTPWPEVRDRLLARRRR
jgi:hypothetical protein